MPGAEHEIPCAVNQDDEPPLQPGLVQGLHTDQSLDHPLSQAGDGRCASPLQEILQGLVHWPAVLCGLRQAIEVVQHLGAVGIQLVVQLSSAAQFAQEQAQPPPHQKPLVVDHQGEEPGIWDLIDPGVQVGKEVANSLGQNRADLQRRPF